MGVQDIACLKTRVGRERRQPGTDRRVTEQSMHLKEIEKEEPPEKHKTPAGEECCYMTTERR